MAVRTIECTECGTTVPYGRLSCPSCGELLASVAGAARRLTSLAEVEPESDVAIEHAPDTHGVPDVAADTGELGSLTWPTVSSDPATAAGVDADSEARSSAPAWTAPPFPPQPSITVAPQAGTPGAYVPPALVVDASASLATDIPAGLPAPARSWAGAANADPAAAALKPGDGTAARPIAELSLTDPARRAEAIDWIAVAGAALGSVGFLLPWARTIVGADGVGYLDTWGLAGPAHVLVVVGMLVVLALAVATTRVPAWLRLGIPGLVLSALLVGLLWPYLLGPLGPLPGAYVSLAGALLLGAAAVAALVTDRHARADLGV